MSLLFANADKNIPNGQAEPSFVFFGGFEVPDTYANFLETVDGFISFTAIFDFFQNLYSFFALFVSFLSALLAYGIIHSVIKIGQVRKEEKEETEAKIKKAQLGETNLSSDRWTKVLALVESDNPSDWKFAVLEADVLLEEEITQLGFEGDSFAEKLKKIKREDLASVDDIWEAHRVRNLIAHKGSDFVLTKRQARSVVSLFGKALREINSF